MEGEGEGEGGEAENKGGSEAAWETPELNANTEGAVMAGPPQPQARLAVLGRTPHPGLLSPHLSASAPNSDS